jgi:PhnB protein
MSDHIRHGVGAVRPYLYGDLATVEFVLQVFQAEVLERLENLGASPGYHVELRIGDAAVVLEASDAWATERPTAAVYAYVPDVDDAFVRAIAFGGTPLDEPEDKPYQERACAVRDPFGNIWYMATYVG